MTIGIDNLKKVALLAVRIVEQAQESFKDGVQPADAPNFLPEIFETIKAVPAFKQLPAEIKDLSGEEILELRKAIQQELNTGDDLVDALIDAIFGWIISSWALYDAIAKLRKPETQEAAPANPSQPIDPAGL